MPCFKGLAVSIHANDGPLSEHSIQRQTRQSRITSYIPVPAPTLSPGSTKPEMSTFSISITLLTPGLSVPYSTPKPTPDDPFPRPKTVGGLPYDGSQRGRRASNISPYVPMTTSPNETIAAYIYFDGRAKEEVATLLRRGEETWVNSRWVSVPDSEGGGLAEREFLFREVGLERWLNGLDLEGTEKDIAAKIQRRKLKLEKRRRIKKEEPDSDDDNPEPSYKARQREKNGVLRYGDDKTAPVETLSGDDSLMSDSDSEDEPPMPEAAGQIKVALYRVLASGEIKRGEYSPQFDAHDDDETENGSREEGQADIDHTTSFAKPKTLDPKTISTQTVTGIDPPEKPYAVFTFLYRGQRQLQKMGILSSPPEQPLTPASTKRKSGTLDFSKLQPLKSTSTAKNFAGYRDQNASKNSVLRRLGKKRKDDDEMDSDADDNDDEEDTKPSGTEDDEKEPNGNDMLSPEDAVRQETLAEGVKKINLLKRQHSHEPLSQPSPTSQTQKSPSPAATEEPPNSQAMADSLSSTLNAAFKSSAANDAGVESLIGSPFKKARSSVSGADTSPIDATAAKKASEAFSSSMWGTSDSPEKSSESISEVLKVEKMEEEDEL